ncbi:hypothetical protein CBL_10724 [Carabus blaptoides fortunei]
MNDSGKTSPHVKTFNYSLSVFPLPEMDANVCSAVLIMVRLNPKTRHMKFRTDLACDLNINARPRVVANGELWRHMSEKDTCSWAEWADPGGAVKLLNDVAVIVTETIMGLGPCWRSYRNR